MTVPLGVAVLTDGWDLGVRTLDVGEPAGERQSAAEAFLDERQPEDATILAGLGAHIDPGRGSDLSPTRIGRDLDGALRRLGRVDAAWLRGADADTPIEASLTVVAERMEAGTLSAWGTADVDPWQLEALLSAADRAALPAPAFLRVRMNLLRRGAERDLLPLASGEGLAVLTTGPFAGGRLTDRHVEAEEAAERAARNGTPRESPVDPALDRLVTLRNLARERSLPAASLALAWLLGSARVTGVVVAARARAEWDVVGEALEAGVTEEELDRVSVLFA